MLNKDPSSDVGSSTTQNESMDQTNSYMPHQNYLTIVQDPYPPLNSSPELFDNQVSNFMDCIQLDDFTQLARASSPPVEVKIENTYDNS